MTSTLRPTSNWSLKEDIRSHWSARAETFDDAFGHRILPGPEHDAWCSAIRARLGPAPLDVLELASGTGEVTKVLLSLGHRVTGIDFSEAMIARSRAKHRSHPKAVFILGDAENTMEAEGAYDAIVCRHLVWTLTDPAAALRDWHRVLKPGGCLLVFDGDFVNLPWRGRLARKAMVLLERWAGPNTHRDPRLAAEHARIMRNLPYGEGLRFDSLRDLASEVGFTNIERGSYAPIARAQRRVAACAQDWVRTWLYERFILCARKPV